MVNVAALAIGVHNTSDSPHIGCMQLMHQPSPLLYVALAVTLTLTAQQGVALTISAYGVNNNPPRYCVGALGAILYRENVAATGQSAQHHLLS